VAIPYFASLEHPLTTDPDITRLISKHITSNSIWVLWPHFLDAHLTYLL